MYKYECHFTRTSSYNAVDGIRSLLVSKQKSRLIQLPVELTSQIFVYAQTPSLAITCTYFQQLCQSPTLRANYLLFRYGPSAVLGEAAMQRKIVTDKVIHHLLTSARIDPRGDDWLFTHACASNHLELGRWLMDATGDTPTLIHYLHLAALKGSIGMVNVLIQQYHVTYDEDTVLAIACRENHVALVKHLVEQYECHLHCHFERHLRNACFYGHHQLVEFILSTGQADVHAHHDAALQSAAYRSYPFIVKMLLDAGAHPDTNQNACIQYAIVNNDLQTLQYLIEAGIDPRVDNDWCLRHACRRGLDQIVVYLLDCLGSQGPDLEEGMPLEEALMHGRVSTVEILLSRGAGPNSRKAIRGLRYIMNPKSKTQNKDHMIQMLVEAGLVLTEASCQQLMPLLHTHPTSKSNLFSTFLSWI